MLKLLVFVFVVLQVHGYQVKDGPLLTYKPSWLKSCKRSDPKMNDCLTELFTVMFPELAKGIPEINVDPFEPLKLDKVSVTKGAGAVILTGSFYNLTVVGPSNSFPTYTDLNIKENTWNFGVNLRQLDIKAKYNLKGHVLILPIIGNGNCELSLGGVDTKVKTNVSFTMKEGREIMQVTSMKLGFTLNKIKVKMDNLFNGNKVLGLTVNTFLNQNGLEIVKELEEPLSENLAQIFTDIINNIFVKLPTDLWLIDDHEEQEMKEDRQVLDELYDECLKS